MRALPCLMVTLVLPGAAPNQVAQPEYELKAEFLLHFPEFVSWPANSGMEDPTRPFVILVLGESPFGDRLDHLTQGRKIQGHPVAILYSADPEALGSCQMVFICASERKHLDTIVAHAASHAVLTVADSDGFGERGVMINLEIESQLPRFEINYTSARVANLSLSAQLLRLARKVY